MEKQTVFIKRYPRRGQIPSNRGTYHANIGTVRWCKKHGFYYETLISIVKTDNVKWWLEEIELPSKEEIYSESFKSDKTPNDFIKGANFILSHLKSNTNETDKV